MLLSKEKQEEFNKLIKPLMLFLTDNCNAYVKVIVDPTRAELLEGSYGFQFINKENLTVLKTQKDKFTDADLCGELRNGSWKDGSWLNHGVNLPVNEVNVKPQPAPINTKEMGLTDAMGVLRKALKEDEGYFIGWLANIAILFIDEYHRSFGDMHVPLEQLHKVANDAAKRFLDILIKE